MITLIFIGLIGGLITGVSPCILPMLPVIFFAGAAGPSAMKKPVAKPETIETTLERTPVAVGASVGPPVPPSTSVPGSVLAQASSTGSEVLDGAKVRQPLIGGRPLKIILGVIVSFTVFTLTGSVILSLLGLPQSFLRWAGLTVLALVGVGMLIPKFEELLQRPFSRLPKAQAKLHGNPFLFGIGLGTLYVPCAGPVLAAITVAGATGHVGIRTVAVTIAFATGAALPLFIFATAGDRIRDRLAAYRSRAKTFRIIGGLTMIALAVALAFGATDALQRAVPDYTGALQNKVANSDTAKGVLSGLTNAGNTELSKCTPGATVLQSCGQAPAITGISTWLNTPGGAPVDLASLRGKVTLIDFWAYSCINCQRSLPHVVAWHKAYAASGLQVIGIHAPEFAFEKSTRNVQQAIKKEGITYPVAQDNSLSTWTNYRNRYWPAEYLIDATGTVRNIKFGEGDYNVTESLIRQLLTQANPAIQLPAQTNVTAPVAGQGITPETYFAYSRSANYQGDVPLTLSKTLPYTLPATQPPNTYSLGGPWTVDTQFVKGASGSQLRVSYTATNVYMVLGGTGSITIDTPGQATRTIKVSGSPTLYPILTNPKQQAGQLTVTTSGGVQFYTATFG